MAENLLIDRPVPPTGVIPREETVGKPKSPRTSGIRTILLVEYRDEVFARLAADLAAVGIRVDRALSAAEASRRYARRPADLLLSAVDLPDETCWLMASKLRLVHPEAQIWVYTPWSSAVEVALAGFVGADELIDCGGDLWRLTTELLDRLSGLVGFADLWADDLRRTTRVRSVA